MSEPEVVPGEELHRTAVLTSEQQADKMFEFIMREMRLWTPMEQFREDVREHLKYSFQWAWQRGYNAGYVKGKRSTKTQRRDG